MGQGVADSVGKAVILKSANTSCADLALLELCTSLPQILRKAQQDPRKLIILKSANALCAYLAPLQSSGALKNVVSGLGFSQHQIHDPAAADVGAFAAAVADDLFVLAAGVH